MRLFSHSTRAASGRYRYVTVGIPIWLRNETLYDTASEPLDITCETKCVDDADVLFGIAKSTTPYDACETIEFEILKYTVNIVKLSEYISYTSLIVAFSNEL